MDKFNELVTVQGGKKMNNKIYHLMNKDRIIAIFSKNENEFEDVYE